MCNNLPEGYELREYEEISSTNAEALRCAGQIEKPTWFFAHKQTAGRGRGGKAWVDPVGNFAATALLFPQGAIQDVALRSFVAGLAGHDALVEISFGENEFSLKWPNDVLLKDKKLAGIEIERIKADIQLKKTYFPCNGHVVLYLPKLIGHPLHRPWRSAYPGDLEMNRGGFPPRRSGRRLGA